MKKMSYKKAAIIYRTRGPNLPLCKEFAEIWMSNDLLKDSPLSDDWDKTVTVWGCFGLIGEDFEGFAESIVRMGDDLAPESRWKYLCGCAWNTIRIIKEIAEGEDLD